MPKEVFGDCEFVVRWRTAYACPMQQVPPAHPERVSGGRGSGRARARSARERRRCPFPSHFLLPPLLPLRLLPPPLLQL